MRRSFILLAALVWAVPAFGQQTTAAAEFAGGWAGFVDEALIDHAVIGGGARFHLTPRISIGPELVYMRGPGTDRDLFLTGNITFDFVTRPPGARAGSVNPFLVAGAGLMMHSDRFASGTFTSYEGALTGGGGARVWLTDRVYALGEWRIGWEPHTRITGGLGVVW
jgi:hypothetical protein